MERASHKIQKTAHHLEHVGKVQEYLFHLSMVMEALFMRYGKILRGLEILHLHGTLSPQLVDPQELYDEVEDLKAKVQSKDTK